MSVLSATLSISLTFFPFLITMHGDMGDFVKSFPWAMFIILSISLSVSIMLTPYLQYTLIHKGIDTNPSPTRARSLSTICRRATHGCSIAASHIRAPRLLRVGRW